jgi:hypothetical protein
MKVLFPNPYGYKLPEKNRVASFNKSFCFSDEYAEFLVTQNGFSVKKLEEDSENEKYLKNSEEDSEGHADLRVLYGFDSGSQYYDLEDNLKSFIFNGIFFPIGVDYGGNDLVEILAGKYKGYIASLDHEMYASSSSVEEFIEEFELDGFHDMSIDEKADVLADEELGLAWFFAKSINDFVELCIHCDNDFSGFVVEAIETESDDA